MGGLLIGGLLLVGTAGAAEIEPQADQLLRKMSNYLSSQQQFTMRSDGATEVVLKDGEKIQFDFDSKVEIKRPNMLRSERTGEMSDAAFFYDGKAFTLFGKRNHFYATESAPGNLDQAIDVARERLGVEAPGADLLYQDPYRMLTEDVVSGRYLGTGEVRDVPCDHLAFRGNITDWEIWIEKGPKPLPRKLVVISKNVPGAPEYTAEFTDWNLAPRLTDSRFHFSPSADAKRVDFMPMVASATPAQGGKQ
jgi:hypothetical protein